jgi:hypothetical protein
MPTPSLVSVVRERRKWQHAPFEAWYFSSLQSARTDK